MVAYSRRSIETVDTSAEDQTTSTSATYSAVSSTSGFEGPPPRADESIRVRYGETQLGVVVRAGKPITDIKPYAIDSKDTEINAYALRCDELVQGMLETKDLIERENLYRTLNEYLTLLFELRSGRDRSFGTLLIMLLGITQHTTSEFFSSTQLAALQRALALVKKPTILDTDLQDARRLLSGAQFDLLRPLRGVFPDA